ncbi:hypothetical protein BGX27_000289 [Mortierella sp. AM989]|nr:hypothetical protein BGX27_000289 [Mortierella sp. AM989]
MTIISEGPKDTMEKAEAWKPSSLSSIIVDEPNLEDQQQHDLHTSLDQELKEKRDAVIPPPFKSLLSDHLRDPHKSASLVTPSEPMERDINPQKPFLATEQPASQSSNGIPIVDIPISIPITAGEDTFFPPPHVTAPPSLALPAVKPVELNSDNNHTPAEPNVQPHIPEFNPGPISLLHPPIPATAIPQSRFDEPQNDSADLDNTHGSHGKSLFQQYDAPGYNLVGLHWIIFVGTQAMLVFFLLVLFLGVLILTEYALDLEDEDIANLTYHYWARVVGVVMTTVISAVHGSLLSGYVIMDGQSDWIAKAAVGATCLYWGAMTWATNRVAGPLPY